MNRYRVVPGSMRGHGCCFEASVVDTLQPVLVGVFPLEDEKGQPLYVSVCECVSVEVAEYVCTALNRSH